MDIFDLVLVVGLTARATRLAVYDAAGDIIRTPIIWAASRFGRRGEAWADDLLACPFCIGFWLALAAASSWAAWGDTTAWTVIALAATASYAAGHLAGTLDDDRFGGW